MREKERDVHPGIPIEIPSEEDVRKPQGCFSILEDIINLEVVTKVLDLLAFNYDVHRELSVCERDEDGSFTCDYPFFRLRDEALSAHAAVRRKARRQCTF